MEHTTSWLGLNALYRKSGGGVSPPTYTSVLVASTGSGSTEGSTLCARGCLFAGKSQHFQSRTPNVLIPDVGALVVAGDHGLHDSSEMPDAGSGRVQESPAS